MRLIDADKALEHIKKRLLETALNNTRVVCDAAYLYADISDNRIETWINEAPTVDVEPVVRCKDCRHFELQDLSNPKHNTQWCIINGFNPQGMDYCSYGERMDGEEHGSR